MKKKKAITIGKDLNNDIIGRQLQSIGAKKASFFCRSLFLFVLCYWKSLRDVFFLQVCKLAGYFFGQKWYINERRFGIQERVSSNKE